MRRVSMKRKSGRRSSGRAATDQAETSTKEKGADNGEVLSDEDAGHSSEEDYEPDKKRKSVKKDKSASFSAKDDQEADAQYEVEAVLGEKVIKRVKHYLIRWKGYGPDSDTWEPASTLNCNELIKEFLANTPSTSTKSTNKEKPTRNGRKSSKSQGTSVTWSETEEFEVDRILEVHHKRDGTREFLVSWKGYPASENSWEPEENMTCGDLIKKFMAKVEKAKESDLRELREKRTPTNRFTLNDATKGRRWSKRNSGKQRVQYHDSE